MKKTERGHDRLNKKNWQSKMSQDAERIVILSNVVKCKMQKLGNIFHQDFLPDA